MEGGGGGRNGATPKVLHLQRALSGGFGFSLMGGRGTGFPPVICDILSDSPASECPGMQVGDIILEINNETMENRSTKEVVTALMKSPDDLMLRVREDLATRERVLKFLAPLDKSQGFQHRGFKSTPFIGSAPRIEKRDYTGVHSDRVVCTSGERPRENGVSAAPEETNTPEEPSARLQTGTSNGDIEGSRILQSPVLPNRTGNTSRAISDGSERDDHVSQADENTSHAAPGQLTPDSALPHSSVSEASPQEEFVGLKLTTTALVHREDSAKGGHVLNSPENGEPCAIEEQGVQQSHDALNDQSKPRLTESAAQLEENMNNGHARVELVRITSTQLPTTYSHSQSVRTNMENGTNVSHNNDTMSSSADSAFARSSPLLKVKTTASNISPEKNQVSEVTVVSEVQPVVSSKPKLETIAIGIQTNPSDLEPRIENGGLKSMYGPAAASNISPSQTKVDNCNSLNTIEAGNTRQNGRDSSSSASQDDMEFPDMNSLESALHENPKNLDVPSAKRLAKRLYELDGFKREDVSIHLSKRNDFCKLVAKEYLGYFDFTGRRLDEGLREFLRCVTIIGETQERERVLAHFSHRYFECNPGVVESSDAAHTLTCAVMLLNTDLHGQNIGKKMSLSAFMLNLEGMNDGVNFARSSLKALYSSIKSQPLAWIVDDDDDGSDVSSLGKGKEKKLPKNGTLAGNPLVQVDDDPNAPVYIQGYIMRKEIVDVEGKKTAKGKRSWKMYFGTVKGLCLYLHKSEVAKDTNFQQPKDVMRLHHALSSRSGQYDKKPNVFSLRLANWSEYLIQCLDTAELQQWMQALNLACAVHSSPPLPAAVGSQVGFRRPVLPSATSKLDPAQQLASHDEKVEGLERELEDHRSFAPDKKTKAKIIKDYKTKDEYLEYEISRFKTYIYLLRSQPLSSLPPRTPLPSSSPISTIAKKSSPAPTPKFASSHSVHVKSTSSSTLPKPKYASFSSPSSSLSSSSSPSSSTSSSASSSPDKRKSLEEEVDSKPGLRKSNSGSSGADSHSDLSGEDAPPTMRDNSHKDYVLLPDEYYGNSRISLNIAEYLTSL